MIWTLKGLAHLEGALVEVAQSATREMVRNRFVAEELVSRIQVALVDHAGANPRQIHWRWYLTRSGRADVT